MSVRRAIGVGLLTIDDAAEQLNVTPRFIRRLVAERRIGYSKVGKFIRFDPADVERWLEERYIEACQPAQPKGQR